MSDTSRIDITDEARALRLLIGTVERDPRVIDDVIAETAQAERFEALLISLTRIAAKLARASMPDDAGAQLRRALVGLLNQPPQRTDTDADGDAGGHEST